MDFDFPGSEYPLRIANPLGAFGKTDLECWITGGSFGNTVKPVIVVAFDALDACHVSQMHILLRGCFGGHKSRLQIALTRQSLSILRACLFDVFGFEVRSKVRKNSSLAWGA